MNTHLSTAEFTDAMDGALAPSRCGHLDGCAACRDQLAALLRVSAQVNASAGVPEPSPLFWDHFSARVHQAIEAEPLARPAWWQSVWRPALGIGVALTAAVFVVMMRMPGSAPVPAVSSPAPTEPVAIAADDTSWKAIDTSRDDEAWDVVVAMASQLSADELHGVVHVTSPAAVQLDDLTADEREAFVKLLRQEMGGLE